MRNEYKFFNGTTGKVVETTMERAIEMSREEVLNGAPYVRLYINHAGAFIKLGEYFPADNPYKYERVFPELKFVMAEPVLPKIKRRKPQKRPNFGVSPSE